MDCRLPAGEPNRARSWTSVALVMVIFTAGLLCGAAGMLMFPEAKRPTDWSDLLNRVARRMQEDLDLTEIQQANIQTIVRAPSTRTRSNSHSHDQRNANGTTTSHG